MGGWRGYSTNVYMLIRGGSAPRSNSLHFYKPFFYVKGTPFVYLLLTNGISFTDLISNFASLLTSHQVSQQTNSGHVCDQPGLPVPEAMQLHLIFLDVTMYVFMYVHHHICLDFKYGPRNQGPFVRSQSIQKENKRTFRTQIKCDVENLKQNPLGN